VMVIMGQTCLPARRERPREVTGAVRARKPVPVRRKSVRKTPRPG
jgi:hypothetical protein